MSRNFVLCTTGVDSSDAKSGIFVFLIYFLTFSLNKTKNALNPGALFPASGVDMGDAKSWIFVFLICFRRILARALAPSSTSVVGLRFLAIQAPRRRLRRRGLVSYTAYRYGKLPSGRHSTIDAGSRWVGCLPTEVKVLPRAQACALRARCGCVPMVRLPKTDRPKTQKERFHVGRFSLATT